ncbi:MAG: hypothetical protein GXO75_08940 [Calditrichaeota bacterium]|nr:hypothetical protein [Calditrichota bacterium]
MAENLIAFKNKKIGVIPLSYYIDWTGLEDFRAYHFDAEGIPRVDYGSKLGLQYNAITTAQYGLFQLKEWEKEKQTDRLNSAFSCGEWLMQNIREWRPSIKAWVYDFGLVFYGHSGAWISAMAQGEAISLLIRLYQLQPRQEFLNTAKEAFAAFLYNVEDGGVCSYLKNGDVVFEEYATSAEVHVLNGHIFALFGVHDYAAFFGDKAATELEQRGVATLVGNWKHWDTGYWCRYDLFAKKRLASTMYQELHVRQMRALAELYAADEFFRLADRWQGMLKNPVNRVRWFLHKVFEKLTIRNQAF